MLHSFRKMLHNSHFIRQADSYYKPYHTPYQEGKPTAFAIYRKSVNSTSKKISN